MNDNFDIDKIDINRQIKAVQDSINYFCVILRRNRDNIDVANVYKKHIAGLSAVKKTLTNIKKEKENGENEN